MTRVELRRSSQGQSGFGLTEVLVAVVILGIVGAGVATAMLTSLTTGAMVNLESRLNSLTTAFGETVKSLPYLQCAEVEQYQNEFESSDQQSDTVRRLMATPNSTFEVVSVEDAATGGPSCPDGGTQRIVLRVDLRNRSREVTIVKRNPDPKAPPAEVDFTWEFYLGVPNGSDPGPDGNPSTADDIPTTTSSTIGIRLIPDIESPSGVVLLEWWCDGSWVPANAAEPSPPGAEPDHIYRTDSPIDEVLCGEYAAPRLGATPNSETDQRTAALRVTDGAGRQYVKTHVIPFTRTIRGIDPPIAAIQLLSSPPCVEGALCPYFGEVRLDGFGSSAGEGRRLESCTWNFGDGSADESFYGPSCPNSPVAHRFAGSSTVTLTLRDDLGNIGAATREIKVAGPNDVRPAVEMLAAVGEQGSYTDWTPAINGISPSRVKFRATASPGNDDGTITGFRIEYPDGTAGDATGPGVPGSDPGSMVFEPTYGGSADGRLYSSPNSPTALNCPGRARGYPVKVTVTERLEANPVIGRPAAVDLTNTSTVCVTIDPFNPPAVYTSRDSETAPPFPQYDGVVNYRNVWQGVWPNPNRYTEFRFAGNRPAIPAWVRSNDLRMRVQFQHVYGLLGCEINNDEHVLTDLLGGPNWVKSFRYNGRTLSFGAGASRCGYRVQMERRFENNWYPSGYSNTTEAKPPV